MEYIAPGIVQIDSLFAGKEHLSASFLVEGTEPALVETGAQTSAKTVENALRSLGLGPEDLRWIIVTHIHLDHAGGVGDLLQAFPKATAVVHEAGARHLIDPTRLIDSAARVYGTMLDTVYGRMLASPADRVLAASDAMTITVAPGRTLSLIYSPGHAKHHMAVLDNQTGTLMVGDAIGVLIPEVGILRPATPPPDFDLEQAMASVQHFRSLNPAAVVLTHYGKVDQPIDTLIAAEALMLQWVNIARAEFTTKPDATVQEIAHAFEVAFADVYKDVPPQELAMFDPLNALERNAAGIWRYLSLQHDAVVEGH